ncbi:MAG: UDP-3-O-acyl-N-acetylglucosamine deacetylase [Planctomycetota bacterium]|jgi:UDP-3-O-[3-hydroxymyristoyl] N-acetylglucosamine deacetylase/3-hydroxyacyl-[acyl-carrier-protein] dehydratase|nr:UDP-3-O-acyl-N-acetylglucosamine deacetylase [Planctomycetota bacterium]
MARNQNTIKKSVGLEGVSLHSGEKATILLEPAVAGTGIVFRRSDIEDCPDIPALASHLTMSQRRTVLQVGPAQVGMVEHLLSACHGLGVDNLIVTVSGPELPGTDGSALPFAELLLSATIVEQKQARRVFTVLEPHVIRDGDAEIILLPPSGDGLKIRYIPEYPDGIDASPISFDTVEDDYLKQIALARTFVRAEEIEQLLEAGFGKGATAENTVVLGGDSNVEMRLDCEPTRHKISDLLGDLYLAGIEVHADIVARKSGHALNQSLAQHLLSEYELFSTSDDINEDGYDIQDVMRLLPHRYPFLLIDRVLRVEGWRRAVGIKNVTINEPFFGGHFPDQPLMPGVLQLEALAQLSGFLLQRKMDNTGKLVVLAAIDKVRFRGGVVPGDQLYLEVETLRMNRSRASIKAQAKVGKRVVSEAVLSFAMVASA